MHPYLKNRDLAEEDIPYPKDESGKLRAILKRTRGVPLFQEQAMQIAIDCAGFSPPRADKLRRAMATFRRAGFIHKLREEFINGMVKNEYEKEFAERCFKQIEGFGEYGFPESHAASFAILVYVSSWVKYHYPEVFCAALLNSQPMGFYAPAQLVRDAREHRSRGAAAGHQCQRLGQHAREDQWRSLRLAAGLSSGQRTQKEDMKHFVKCRTTSYRDPADVWRRGGLNKRQILALARADAFASMGLSRRDVLWAVRAFSETALPLLDARPAVRDLEPKVALPKLTLGEQIVDDYSTISMSLRAHPLELLRPTLSERRMAHSQKLREDARNGDFLQMAGLVLVRQRPGTASGVVFITLEDEFGIANLVVWPKVFETYRRIVMGSRLLGVAGKVQRVDSTDDIGASVIHLVAERLWDWSADLDRIADLDGHFELRMGRGDQAHSSTPDPRDEPRRRPVPNNPPAKKPPHDRSRIIFDRPQIRIAPATFTDQAALRSTRYSLFTFKRDARREACHRSYSICMPSHVSGAPPKALVRRIAISGEIPERPLINSERVLRVTPKARGPPSRKCPEAPDILREQALPDEADYAYAWQHSFNDSRPSRYRQHPRPRIERPLANFPTLTPPIGLGAHP